MLNKARIAVLVSGGGTNLEALFNAQAAGALPHGEIVAVVSSNPDAFALERARRRGVPAYAAASRMYHLRSMLALFAIKVDMVFPPYIEILCFALQIKSSGLQSEQGYLYHGGRGMSTGISFNRYKSFDFS